MKKIEELRFVLTDKFIKEFRKNNIKQIDEYKKIVQN